MFNNQDQVSKAKNIKHGNLSQGSLPFEQQSASPEPPPSPKLPKLSKVPKPPTLPKSPRSPRLPKSPKSSSVPHIQTANISRIPPPPPPPRSPKLNIKSQVVHGQYHELEDEKIEEKIEEKIIAPSQLPEVKDIKVEEIDIDIDQLRRLSQPGRRSIVDVILGRHPDINYYSKLKLFFDSLHLTREEAKGIQLKELDQLVNQDWYGKFLSAYGSNHVFFKLFAFWFLDEAGIKLNQLKSSDLTNNAIALDDLNKPHHIQENSKEQFINPNIDSAALSAEPFCSQPITQYFKSRVWPKNRILLFEDQKILAKAYSVEAGTNSLTWFNKIWMILITSLLANDIYFYYAYPEQRYGNTLYKILISRSEHTKMLSTSLTSVTVWPELVAFPFLLVIEESLWKRFHPTHSIATEDISAIQDYWTHYQPNLKQDLFYPFLSFMVPMSLVKRLGLTPFPTTQYSYNNLLKTLLWDGEVKANDRIELFKGLKMLLNKSSKLTRLNILTLLEALAENIHPKDIERLYQKGYDPETIKALLQIQSESLSILKNQAKWQNLSSILFMLYAHFLLWNIGQSETKLLQPFFWLFQTYRWYATVRFFVTLGEGIKRLIDQYLAKKACEAEGKLWMYMDQIADYECTVCGDLPIYYGYVFANEDCIYAWLETKTRTPRELIDFITGNIGKVDFSQITELNFYKQYLNGKDLRDFLLGLKKRAVHLQTLNLFMTRPLNATGQSIDSMGMQAIADFITEVPVMKLDLSYQSLHDNATSILGQKLNISLLQTLDLSGNTILDEGAISLGQGLPGSSLQKLSLSHNNINGEGVKGLRQGLRGSSLQTLDLRSNNIGAEGARWLAEGLSGSSLKTLYLGYNDIGAEGTKGLGRGLSNSSLQVLYLESNNIGDEGAEGLGQGLNSSSLRRLYLQNNYIGDKGAKGLGQGLSNSSLQLLNLQVNNIGADGAKGLGQGLPSSSLQALYLYDNNIGSEGAEGLGQGLSGSSLQTLFLGANNIGDGGAKGLGQGLPGSSLQRLYLNSNNIDAEGAKGLGQGLNNSSLQRLHLGDNNIGAEGAKGLAQGLNGSSLQILYLYANNIGPEGAKSLGQNLNGSSLQILYLGNNNIGDEGAKGLGQGLPGSSLRILYLGTNNINDEGAKGLGQGFYGSSLEVLDLYWNDIGDEGAKGLGQGLNGSFLQSLELNSNKIGARGAKGLGQGLFGSSLQILSLESNSIGAEGAKNLGQGLPNSPLQVLALPSNNIGGEGAKGLGQGLRGSSLQMLFLGNNEIGDEGAKSLGQGLPGSSLQQGLFLENNSISDEGAKGLGQGLPGTSLQTLSLKYNKIGDEGAKGLGQGLPGSSLQMLYLQDNNIGDRGAIAIADILTNAPIQLNSYALWIHQFDPNLKKALSQSKPNTNLNFLVLRTNNITDAGAQALCRVIPYSGIPLGNLELWDNPIGDPDLMANCEISAADSRFELPFHLRMIGKLYSSIKEFIWPKEIYRSKFRYENSIIEEINDENIEEKKAFEPLITASPINTMLEPLSALPMPNYQKPSVIWSPVLYQTQNNNSVSSLLLLVILGMMLFWTFKKIIRWDNHNEIKPCTRNGLAEIYQTEQNISRTRKKTSINLNNFWLQSKDKKEKQTAQSGPLQLTNKNSNDLEQALPMDNCHY